RKTDGFRGRGEDMQSRAQSVNSSTRDIALAQQLMQLDRRLMQAMPRIMPGMADDSLLAELSDIQPGYEDLLPAGPPSFPLYIAVSVRIKIADVENFLARANDSMNRVEAAVAYFEQAAQHYDAAGDSAKAAQSRASLGRLRFTVEADVN